MRNPTEPFKPVHRLARLNAWARLWLAWFAGLFAAWCSAGGRMNARELDRLARGVGRLIVINAAARFVRPPRSSHRHGRLKRAQWSTVLGSAIRRAMRGKDAPTRLVAILSVMRDLDLYVERVLKRLPRGLTRLRVILPAPQAAAALDAPPCASIAPCIDTS